MIGLRPALALLLAAAAPKRRRPSRKPHRGNGPDDRLDAFKVGAINAPRWSPKKRWVVSAVVQAVRMKRLFARLDLDAAGILESYPAQRAALRSPRWAVWAPQGNPGGPGQGLVRRRTPRHRRVRLKQARTVPTPFARYARAGGLKMGAAVLRRGDLELPTAVIHLPTEDDDTDDQWRDQVKTVARSLPDHGPACVLADVNRDPGAVCEVMGPGWRVVARADVIVVLARDCDVIADGVQAKGYHNLIGDHSAVPWAELRPRGKGRR